MNYTNQFPSADALKPNDILTITQSMNGVLPQGEYIIDIHGTKGGGAQGVRYTARYISSGAGSYQLGGASGGQGGRAAAGRTRYTTLRASAVNVVVGTDGKNWMTGDQYHSIDVGESAGTFTGQGGGNGTPTAISFDESLVLQCTGGTGGSSPTIYLDKALDPPRVNSRTHQTLVMAHVGDIGEVRGLNFSPLTLVLSPRVVITVVKLNSGPSTPSYIRAKGTALSDRILDLECGESFDPEGDPIRYIWQQQLDNTGLWTSCRLADGTDAVTNDRFASIRVPASGTTILFRVQAIDDKGAESAWRVQDPPGLTIIYNYPPTISGTDEDRGDIQSPFTYDFTVDDQEPGDTIKVTISLDNQVIDTITNAARGQTYTADFSNGWMYTPSGDHKLIITAEDDKGGSAKRIISFTRVIPYLEVITATPISINGDKILNFIAFLKLTAPAGSTVTALANNNWPSDTPADWHDFSSYLRTDIMDAQIFKFLDGNGEPIEGSGQLMVRIKVEKPQGSKETIIFSGATFMINANGDEAFASADTVYTRPNRYPSGGLLTSEPTVEDALDTISTKSNKLLGDMIIPLSDWVKSQNSAGVDMWTYTILDSRIPKEGSADIMSMPDDGVPFELDEPVAVETITDGEVQLRTFEEPMGDARIQVQIFNGRMFEESSGPFVPATKVMGRYTKSGIKLDNSLPNDPTRVFYAPYDENFNDEINGVPIQVVGSPAIVTGKAGNAANFPGNGSYIKYPPHNIRTGEEMSVAFWCRFNGRNGSGSDWVISNGSTMHWAIAAATGLVLAIAGKQFTLSSTIQNGEWMHIAFTVDAAGIVKTYKNGVLVTTEAFTAPSTTGTEMVVGASSGGTQAFIGVLDDLRIYNEAKTQDEIQAMMNYKG